MVKPVKSPSKHYSPLRYPGGKACLADFLSNVIKENKIENVKYVEPYAGGSGAALSLLFLEKVDSIVINDLDKAIYSFWKAILSQTDKFIAKIRNVELSIDEWNKQKAIYKNKKSSILDLGFATFFLNRTNRSGIIEAGPIGGMSQTGKWLIDARFNKTELITRIENIASYGSRITVTNQDGISLLKEMHAEENVFIYLDPPYYVKGSCLYLNHYQKDNHQQLSEFLNTHNDFFWIMTYDNVTQIKDLYTERRVYDFSFHYHVDLPKLGNEVLILSDRIEMTPKVAVNAD